MPRKTFIPGEVLAAAAVNTFLMDQSVMTFADSDARDLAIPTPSEGMVTYLEDTDALEVFNGTSFVPAAPASGGSGNAIINGAFEINQREYASAGTLASGAYGFDRWKATAADTTLTFTSAPQGQELTINDTKGIKQIVERNNLPAGTYTLSFTGTATGRVYNTGATPPAFAASPITVTLDGLANVEVEFTATGGTKTLSRVQLEAGTTATPFRRNANSSQGELAACHRYYQQHLLGGSSDPITTVTTLSGSFFIGVIPLFQQMRASPTMEIVTGTNFYIVQTAAGNSTGPGFNLTVSGRLRVRIDSASFAGGLTAGQAGYLSTNNANARINFSAEL